MKMGLNPLVKMKRDGDMGSEPHTYIQGLFLNSKSAQQEQKILTAFWLYYRSIC